MTRVWGNINMTLPIPHEEHRMIGHLMIQDAHKVIQITTQSLVQTLKEY